MEKCVKADGVGTFELIGLDVLQYQRAQWAQQFPKEVNDSPYSGMLKVVEELGELSGHLYNLESGTRQNREQAMAGVKDALGDVVISLMAIATACKVNLQECIATEWDKVRKRDYQACPIDGITPRLRIKRDGEE